MNRRARRAGAERGAVIVEFALLLPVFVMLILGTFTGGHAYFRKISITDAVREGARFGATLDGAVTDEITWKAAVQDRVAEISGGELSSGDVCVAITGDAADVSCGVDTPADATGHVVKVSASKDAEIEWLLGSTTVALRGDAAARYERD